MRIFLFKIKNPLRAGFFICNIRLAEPPNFFAYDNTNKVDEPEERNTNEDKDDGKNDTENVFSINTLKNAVNSPENVEHRDAENKLYKPGKVIDCFNEIFHYKPPKIIFILGILSQHVTLYTISRLNAIIFLIFFKHFNRKKFLFRQITTFKIVFLHV